MALPTDNSETFLREVDENLRRDRVRDFGKTYGTWIAIVVVLFLAAIGGWLYWQHRQQQQAALQSEELNQVFSDIAAQKMQTVRPRLETLAGSDNPMVRGAALLTFAAVALESNDRPAAIAKYRQAMADEGIPRPYRDAATIRATALEFDSMQPQAIVARLKPLAVPGQPWFGSAGEMTAMALVRQGQNAQAGRLFAAIAADRQVPESLRSRAVQIAGTLGVDASASLPAFDQQER